jgi:DNA (cytosine-5)-methyltransferase 1
MNLDERPTHIDLFSGIGGFALAAQWAGFRTIAFCEIDKYCQKVLTKNFGFHPDPDSGNGSAKSRKQQKELAAQPDRICANIFDFDGTTYRGANLLTGGFPCQPFSVAGKRRGAEDDRHLWPEMLRVINEARPAWILGENVPGIIPMELDNVLSDMESIGYATTPFVIPACAVDARHRRDRLWIIGREATDAHQSRFQTQRIAEGLRETKREACSGAQRGSVLGRERNPARWQLEPDVGRVAHGIPSRVDRLKGLGNAIVPQVAYEILREIRNLIP